MKILYFYIIAIIIIVIFLYIYFNLIKELDYNLKLDKSFFKKSEEKIDFPVYRYEDKIPKKIYRFELGNLKSRRDQFIDILNNSNNNSSCEQILMDDEECINFIKEYYNEEVLQIYNYIGNNYYNMKSDLLRYLVIYAKGGIYMDFKTEICKPIKENIFDSNKLHVLRMSDVPLSNVFWTMFPPYGEYIASFFIAPKGHPVLRKVIEQILNNIKIARTKKCSNLDILAITGPLIFTKIVRDENFNIKVHNSTLEGSFKRYSNKQTSDKNKHWKQLREPLFN